MSAHVKGVKRMIRTTIVGLALAAVLTGTALAGDAEVVDARATESGGTWRFDVTVRHPDTGWDNYADKWDVMTPDGTVLGTRVLLHPHETEQPFTRSLSGVEIPDGIEEVLIRAHDNVDGYGETTFRLTLQPRVGGDGY